MSKHVRVQLIQRTNQGVNEYIATDFRGREYSFPTRREIACKYLSCLEAVGSLIREYNQTRSSGQAEEVANYYSTNEYLLRQAAKVRKESVLAFSLPKPYEINTFPSEEE
jgi:hypothetical protein